MFNIVRLWVASGLAALLLMVFGACTSEAFSGHSRCGSPASLSWVRLSGKTLFKMTPTTNENPLDGGELLATLDSLDREWKLQQQAEGSTSRWTKLVLPRDEYQRVTEQAAAYESLQDFVYLLEPPSGEPDFILSFLGGAGE